MPPKEGSGLHTHKSDSSDILNRENDIAYALDQVSYDVSAEPFKFKDLVWRNISAFIVLHSLTIYGFYMTVVSPQIKWQTVVAEYLFGLWSLIGITGGYHRLWAHRSYKAKLPLRIFLAFWGTVALQNDIYEWSRDHRVHHKYSETNADPHNATRGFFFSHMGWLCLKKHPAVKEKGKAIDLSDLWADPVVRFQRRFYIPLIILCWGVIPTLIPVYFWNETPLNAFLMCVITRYVVSLHLTWCTNSVAHLWGDRPYDKNIGPSESHLHISTLVGEGYHNYHHTFPWDYKAAEFKWNKNANLTSLFIDSMASIGQVYDRKSAPVKVIKARQERTGYELKPQYWLKLGGSIGWITSIMFTTMPSWIFLIVRLIYWQRLTLNPV